MEAKKDKVRSGKPIFRRPFASHQPESGKRPMTMTISHLIRRFGPVEVLRGIDLEVRKGELIALLGPSGSGKTTLLKIIAGLDWPDAGGLAVNGQDWLARKAQERRTGFVFQHYALFPHMKVADNVAFGLTVLPRAQRPSAAKDQGAGRGASAFPPDRAAGRPLSGRAVGRAAPARGAGAGAGHRPRDPASRRALRRARCAGPPRPAPLAARGA